MPSFNLVDESWIPCIPLDGTRRLYSLRETLCNAATLREIADDSPLVNVSLTRFLLAILHRCFGPPSFDGWCALWTEREWDRGVLDAYLDKHAARFDLFDAEQPFYQVPRMDDVKDDSRITRLRFERTSGHNTVLFDHSTKANASAVSPDVAARHLIAYHAFAIAGGQSRPFNFSDGLLTRGYSILAIGENLFETLCLNLLPLTRNTPIVGTKADRPTWEQEEPQIPEKEGNDPLGYTDYLTWQSRRIFLEPEGEPPMVQRCQVQQNLKMRSDLATGYPLDPFKSYRKNKDGRFVVLHLEPDRSVWRDSDTLFQPHVAESDCRPPLVFNHLARVKRVAEHIGAQRIYGFDVYGYTLTLTKEGKRIEPIVFWRQVRLPLPLAYLEDEDLYAVLKRALQFAESAGRTLQAAGRRFAELIYVPDAVYEAKKTNPRITASPTSGPDRPTAVYEAKKTDPRITGKKKDIDNLLNSLAFGQRYWSSLETPFAQFIVAQAEERQPGDTGEVPPGEAYGTWGATVERAAREDFDTITASLDSSARVLRATVGAERVFNGRLRRYKEEAGLIQEEVEIG